MCCPFLKYEPDEDPRYDDIHCESSYADILENLIIKKVPTNVLKIQPHKLAQTSSRTSNLDSPRSMVYMMFSDQIKKTPSEPRKRVSLRSEITYSGLRAQSQPNFDSFEPEGYYLTGSPIVPLDYDVNASDSNEMKYEAPDQTVMFLHNLVTNPDFATESNVRVPFPHKTDCICYKQEHSTSGKSSPPPDIKKTIDKLASAQPKKKTPGFPAKNQRFVHRSLPIAGKTENVGVHQFGVTSDDSSAPIVYYEESVYRHQDTQERSKTCNPEKSEDAIHKFREEPLTGDDSEAIRSVSDPESDITSTTKSLSPLAEISQIKGPDLKWKIIIKQHKDKKKEKKNLKRREFDPKK